MYFLFPENVNFYLNFLILGYTNEGDKIPFVSFCKHYGNVTIEHSETSSNIKNVRWTSN